MSAPTIPSATHAELAFGPVHPSDAAALEAFFERCEVACRCRYWHFTGDKNAWLNRCFHEPAENARELRHDVEHAPHLLGVVVRDPIARDPAARDPIAPAIRGWMKITPAPAVDKLYQQRLYKNLPCFGGDRSGTFTIGCVLIEPEFRHRGLAHHLLAAAIDAARSAGARHIEAFPRRGEHLGDPELFMGPISIFERAGFQVVNDFAPYPVLRLEL